MDKENNTEAVFVKKIVKEAGLDAPSLDFTTSILAKIEMEGTQNRVMAYRPLISKNYWIGLAVIITSIMISFLMFGSTTTELEWLEVKISKYTGPMLHTLTNITIAPTYVYGALGLLFYIYVQIYFLRRYANSRYPLI